MRKAVCVGVMLMVLSSYASARNQTYLEWRGTVSSDWATAANWTPSTSPPTAFDTTGVLADPYMKAGFKGISSTVPASPVIGVGTTVSTDQIVIGGGNSGAAYAGGNLTLGGGTVNVSEFVNIGNARTNDTQYDFGTFTMNSGTLNCGVKVVTEGRFIVGLAGTGTVNQNGGTINLTTLLILAQNATSAPNTSKGFVNLYGGIFNAGSDITMGGTSANSKITITNGQLVFNSTTGALLTKLQGFVTSGQIVTTLPGKTIQILQDTDLGTTTVFAAPEPATLCLLGLGVVGLLRRKVK